MSYDRHTHGWDHERHKGRRAGTLWLDYSDIDGDITLATFFDTLSDVSKHDLLDDWIGLLTKERDLLHKKMYGE
jgi:hypothetical protein